MSLPVRGTGLLKGTARKIRGMGKPLSEIERAIRHTRIYGQLTSYPIIPVLDRMSPILSVLKNRPTIIPRTKLLGAFGIIEPKQISIEETEFRGYTYTSHIGRLSVTTD